MARDQVNQEYEFLMTVLKLLSEGLLISPIRWLDYETGSDSPTDSRVDQILPHNTQYRPLPIVNVLMARYSIE